MAAASLGPEARALVHGACAEAVRQELERGLPAIRRVVREELERAEDEESEEEEESEESADERAGAEGEKPKLIILVRDDLSMSTGKVAAQVGHAVHQAVTDARWRDVRAWETSGAKKVTLKVDSEEQLRELMRDARARGLAAASIQDAGHTEVAPGTTTVLAIGPARSRDVDRVTGQLRPLPDRARQLERENEKLRARAERLQKELDASKRRQRQIAQQLVRIGRHVM